MADQAQSHQGPSLANQVRHLPVHPSVSQSIPPYHQSSGFKRIQSHELLTRMAMITHRRAFEMLLPLPELRWEWPATGHPRSGPDARVLPAHR